MPRLPFLGQYWRLGLSDVNKLLTILRGLPGSGKSTRARQIRDQTGALVISNDDYFTNAATGRYIFDRAHLDEAVKSCKFNVMLAMRQNIPHIVVDNCFIYRNPIEWYRDAAFKNRYRVEVEIIGETTPEAVETYHARNIHGVPRNVLASMARAFQK